jgi:hypothetical protein
MGRAQTPKPGAIRKRLHDAQAHGDVVRLRRTIRGTCDESGWIAMVGAKWMLMAATDDQARLDGFIALRVRDIARIDRDTSSGFIRQALELQGQWPPPDVPAGIKLDRTRDAIASLAAASPLVTLHCERRWRDECYIGVPVGWKRRSVELLDVTPDAEWDPDPRVWRLRDVTRVDVGGHYERMLHAVAGPPPG